MLNTSSSWSEYLAGITFVPGLIKGGRCDRYKKVLATCGKEVRKGVVCAVKLEQRTEASSHSQPSNLNPTVENESLTRYNFKIRFHCSFYKQAQIIYIHRQIFPVHLHRTYTRPDIWHVAIHDLQRRLSFHPGLARVLGGPCDDLAIVSVVL